MFHNFDISWLLINLILYQLIAFSSMLLLRRAKAKNIARWTLGAASIGALLYNHRDGWANPYLMGPFVRTCSVRTRAFLGSSTSHLVCRALHRGFANHWYCYALLPLLLPRTFLESRRGAPASRRWHICRKTCGQLVVRVTLYAACFATHFWLQKVYGVRSPVAFATQSVSQFGVHHRLTLKLVVRLQKRNDVSVDHALLVYFLYQF